MLTAEQWEREAFLVAVYAKPESDVPRLAFADWLEEHGEAAWAEFIRIDCELARISDDVNSHNEQYQIPFQQFWNLAQQLYPDAIRELDDGSWKIYTDRGFLESGTLTLGLNDFHDPLSHRAYVMKEWPQWYGADTFRVRHPSQSQSGIFTIHHLEWILNSPVTRHVTQWCFQGAREYLSTTTSSAEAAVFAEPEIIVSPVITFRELQWLTRHPIMETIESLDVTDNNLGNDAARVLIQCPELSRLRCLKILDGNNLRGRTWQQLLERFGDDVVQ